MFNKILSLFPVVVRDGIYQQIYISEKTLIYCETVININFGRKITFIRIKDFKYYFGGYVGNFSAVTEMILFTDFSLENLLNV